VSVTLKQMPDLRIVTLTLLTTRRTSIGGLALVTGALQTYRALVLRGVASLAEQLGQRLDIVRLAPSHLDYGHPPWRRGRGRTEAELVYRPIWLSFNV
jgi:hypothetical protein